MYSYIHTYIKVGQAWTVAENVLESKTQINRILSKKGSFRKLL